MSRSKVIAQPWTNKIGQVINPGDDVVAVACSTGRTHVYRGKFAGVYEGSTYSYQTKKFERGVTAVGVLVEREFMRTRREGEQPQHPEGHWRNQYITETKSVSQPYWNKNVFKLDTRVEEVLEGAKKLNIL